MRLPNLKQGLLKATKGPLRLCDSGTADLLPPRPVGSIHGDPLRLLPRPLIVAPSVSDPITDRGGITGRLEERRAGVGVESGGGTLAEGSVGPVTAAILQLMLPQSQESGRKVLATTSRQKHPSS